MKHVAFLRAINVGGHTVKMERLRELFDELEVADVETFIASGNVIYTADRRTPGAMQNAIEAHLQKALGYEVTTFVRTDRELAEVAALDPFPEIELVRPDVLWVGFLQRRPAKGVRDNMAALQTPTDLFQVDGREVYWLRRRSLGESVVTGAQLARALGMPTTTRNVNTIQRLTAKYPPAPG